MDLTLDDHGAFAWARGYYAGPVISTAARRPTLDEPHPVEGSSPQDPDSEEVAPKAAGLGDPLAPAAPRLELDPMTWAHTQFAAARRGGRRRTGRLVPLAAQVAGDPSSGLPKQTGGDWGDLKAAYRLLDRPEATFAAIASPHWQDTAAQAEAGRFLIL